MNESDHEHAWETIEVFLTDPPIYGQTCRSCGATREVDSGEPGRFAPLGGAVEPRSDGLIVNDVVRIEPYGLGGTVDPQ